MSLKVTMTKTSKLLLSTAFSIALLSLSLVLRAADPPIGKIMKTDAAPAIDGNAMDPMWENAQAYSLDSIAKGEPLNSSATWKALWDEEYIYILVEVEDDILNYGADIDPWNRDAVEVFFDINNTDDTGESISVKQYDVGDWQFRYNLVDKTISVGRGEDGVATDSKDGDHIETGTNYVVELKFKWSELKSSLDFTPAKGAELGIEVAVMDNDGEFEGAMSWYANANEAHKTSTYFGTAILDEPISIPAQTGEFMKTIAAPAIDGVGNDPMWDNATAYNIETISKGEPSNNSATWKALWDDEFVYVLVEVEDDILGYSADIKEWNRDAVEIFFDIGNTDGSGESYQYELDPGDWQFRYNLVDNSIGVGRGEEGVTTDSKDGMHTENGTNYTVELKFKWSELGASVPTWTTESGAELGFEVAVMDNDGTTDDDFQGAYSWNADANEAHKNSLYFGTVTLEEPVTTPQNTGEIVVTNAAPAIDGVGNDPMWDNATAYNIETISKGEPSNNSATWKALWDDEFVYVLVEVEDDILGYSADIKEWNRDAVEIFFDIGNTDGSGESYQYELDPGDWQFRYNLVDNSIGVGRGEEGVTTDSKDGMHTENGTNYTVELKFKWSELGASVPTWTTESGAELGFEVAVMDNDGTTDDDFQGAYSWNADANEAHKNSTYFGTATLVTETGINDINTTKTVSVYPNPASNLLNLENTSSEQIVSIYDITGKTVKEVSLGSSNSQINISELKQGLYIIKVMDNNDNMNIVKFIKK